MLLETQDQQLGWWRSIEDAMRDDSLRALVSDSSEDSLLWEGESEVAEAILTLYLKFVLGFSEDSATVIYHVFNMFCYFTPLLGAIIADSLLGKFRTIFYLSVIYAFGNVVISISSGPIQGFPQIEFTMLGLALIAFGTGGIKPCVSAFGGDQFKLPEQEKQLQQFFSLFYFAINAGSLISTFITPMLRQDVSCFGNDSCYPLAFGVPAGLMIISLGLWESPADHKVLERTLEKSLDMSPKVWRDLCLWPIQHCPGGDIQKLFFIFLIGKSMYKIIPPEGNIIVRVVSCICHALKRRAGPKTEKKEHWLDYADDRYERTLIEDVKVVLNVLMLYLPLPVFWALFDQQGSRWTFQAARMNGQLGSWTIKPDQMQVINPFLILAMIPMFETVVYPLLSKCHLLEKPLQRITVGGFLAALAFIVSALVEFQLEKTNPVFPRPGLSRLNVINGIDCPIEMLNTGGAESLVAVEPLRMKTFEIPAGIYDIGLLVNMSYCTGPYKPNGPSVPNQFPLEAQSEKVSTILVTLNSDYQELAKQLYPSDDIRKSGAGNIKVRLVHSLFGGSPFNGTVKLVSPHGHLGAAFPVNIGIGAAAFQELEAANAEYQVVLEYGKENITKELGSFQGQAGGVYSILIHGNMASTPVSVHQVTYLFLSHVIITVLMESFVMTPPNTIHMTWQIPQYFLITCGEVMFSITGLEFSFTQAPQSMKAVVQSAWLLTVGFGNLIVVLVAESRLFQRQALEFMFFALFLAIDMMIFHAVAVKYQERTTSESHPLLSPSTNETPQYDGSPM
ncbi:unnamed protein product [Darwinula stevensoni]|uniref:Peptide transporter n=1 Tax=Darwinula stevensoni TaxID=69355 RepID=A0A7R8ZY12_9CRUS|nr:unnamed protein product [Darwinula stevensoni]CAG0879504.1 unnamed protein product [Darwinula stevensoni]